MAWKRNYKWILLLLACVAVRAFSLFPKIVEQYYSLGIFPVLARIQRWLLGWIPFSIGDFFYLIVGIWILVKVIQVLRKAMANRLRTPYLKYLIGRGFMYLMGAYLVFNLLWGLNYDRLGIGNQLQLQPQAYDTPQLQALLKVVVDRLNTTWEGAAAQRSPLSQKSILFTKAVSAYGAAPAFLKYPNSSIKPSLFSYLGNYLGFTGYYNPFSGEAQVNTTVPVFIRPFTTCHEIGHQLGYAKENEANFCGYLAAKNSTDLSFRYSAYFDLYLYAASELYGRDSTLLVPLRQSLRPEVRKDFSDLRAFLHAYENPMEPYIRKLYGSYLKANRQPQGMETYDEVIAWVIAFSKKYGEENL